MSNFETINVDAYRKVFVVGDIHGCFSLLERRLGEVGFDPDIDLLISVGDLVDRGPESHLAVVYADYPWFKFVRGNHEDMTRSGIAGTYHHIRNGGEWYNQLEPDVKRATSLRLNQAPVILEAIRNGRKYGFIHADFATNDWADAEDAANYQSERCMWDRERIARAQHDVVYTTKFDQKPENNWHKPIEGVTHVFFGHTPIDEPLTRDNCSWIDTGAVFKELGRFPTGKLTIVDLDDYV